MKKIYISPSLLIVKVNCVTLINNTSLVVDTQNTVSEQYVKENTSSRSDYNVWNDDWSE